MHVARRSACDLGKEVTARIASGVVRRFGVCTQESYTAPVSPRSPTACLLNLAEAITITIDF